MLESFSTPIMSRSAQAEEAAVDSAIPQAQKAVKRKWVSYIWDTFDKSPEERRLLFKLDSAILTFASLGEHLVVPCHRWSRKTNWLSFRVPSRIFYQVFGSSQHQQCLCVWDVCL